MSLVAILFQSWRVRFAKPQNCAAKSDRPTVTAIDNKEALQGVGCINRFSKPMNAAIPRVQHDALRADGPAFACVDETYVEEIGTRC